MASCSVSPASVVDDPDTHAGRNASQNMQKTRLLKKNSLSLAQKAIRSLRQLSDHAKAETLTTDLDVLLSRHHTELEDFAKEHDTKLEYIQKLTSQSSHYKPVLYTPPCSPSGVRGLSKLSEDSPSSPRTVRGQSEHHLLSTLLGLYSDSARTNLRFNSATNYVFLRTSKIYYGHGLNQ